LLGFSPIEALVAATPTGGLLMEMDVGEVKAGMLAYLLIVDGDPTVDVRLLQNKQKIAAVMKGWQFHRRPTWQERTQ